MDGIAVQRPIVAGRSETTQRLGALFDAHHARLFRLARRLSHSREDALDLVQETFVRAAGSVDAIPDGASPEEAWLVRVLVNIQRDAWRRERVRVAHQVRTPALQAGEHPEPALIAASAVWQALTTLPPRRRAVVVLHELDGLPVRVIAMQLGVRAATVRWHLFRGRRELSAALGAAEERP